jgi:hypothetical protein
MFSFDWKTHSGRGDGDDGYKFGDALLRPAADIVGQGLGMFLSSTASAPSSGSVDTTAVTKLPHGTRYNDEVLYFDIEADQPGEPEIIPLNRVSRQLVLVNNVLRFIPSESLNACVSRLTVRKEPLFHKNQPTTSLAYHAFLTFWVQSDEYYWSIEKNNEGVTMQRSKKHTGQYDLGYVDGMYRRQARRGTEVIVMDEGNGVTLRMLLHFIETLVNAKYNLLTCNCKHFCSAIFNFAAQSKTYSPSMGF